MSHLEKLIENILPQLTHQRRCRGYPMCCETSDNLRIALDALLTPGSPAGALFDEALWEEMFTRARGLSSGPEAAGAKRLTE